MLALPGGVGGGGRVPGWNHVTSAGVPSFPGRGKRVQLLGSSPSTWFDSGAEGGLYFVGVWERGGVRGPQPDGGDDRPPAPRPPAAEPPALLRRGLRKQKGLSGSLWWEDCPPRPHPLQEVCALSPASVHRTSHPTAGRAWGPADSGGDREGRGDGRVSCRVSGGGALVKALIKAQKSLSPVLSTGARSGNRAEVSEL